MSNWEKVPIAELIEKGVLVIGDGYRAKNSEMAKDGIPFIRAGNISGGLSLNDCDLLNFESAKKAGYKSSKTFDVLLTTKGTIGRMFLVKPDTPPLIFSPQICFWRSVRHDILDPEFLFYHMQSPWFLHQLSWSSGQTDMAPYVSLKDQRSSFFIQLPDYKTQRAVTKTLSTIDCKIELNRHMNETLEEMAQAIYKDWFVDFGPVTRKLSGTTDPVKILGGLIPDPNKAAPIAALFPDSFGYDGLPEGWEAGTLSNIATEQKVKAKPDEISSNTPYIGLEHMPRGSIALDSWETAAKVTSAKSRFEKNQILFGKLRSYFHKVGIAPISGICSTDIVVVDAVNEYDRALTCSICASKEFVDYNTQASSGTRMPRTKWKVMGEYAIAIGPETVRKAYSNIVTPMHEKIRHSIIENKTLAETRDYLLPRLMSGEVRVTDINEAA